MIKFNQLSLKTRFILSAALISVCSLLLALGLVAHHNYKLYKDDVSKTAETMADMLAANIAPALLFGDEDAAMDAFVILIDNPDISAAVAFDNDQNVIADYPAGIASSLSVKRDYSIGKKINNKYLEIVKPVRLYNNEVGTIWLQFKLDVLYERLQAYKNIFLISFLVSLAFAIFLIVIIHRVFEKPMQLLMEAAEQVTKERNYRKRIKHTRKDEVGTLLNAFNNMMQVIEERDKQLLEHSENLEQIVEIRTEQINHRANYDALTELPNRYLLLDRLKQSIRNSKRRGGELALLFLDLDRFKVVNDNLGHMVGDKLLIAVAKRMVYALREEDTVSRLGGDEFVILLENIESPEDVANVAKIIITSLKKPFEIMGHTLHVSTSIGIAMYPDDGLDESILLQHADVSMFQAKKSGKGRYMFYDPVFELESRHRLGMETDLRNAMVKDEFMMVFQPIHHVESGQLSGFEALLRWDRNGEGIITPDQFLPVAEEIGLMIKLEKWVVECVCLFIKNMEKEFVEGLRFSINLSPACLRDSIFIQSMVDMVMNYKIDPTQLEIEITEETFLEATDAVFSRLNSLKEFGMSIAIDDFGTGYSSLSYLRNYPVDTLKIDGCFINDLETNQSSRGIISSTIALGHSLGLNLIAEGVENRQQLKFLENNQCDLIQGHYFSTPLLPDEVLDYIQSSTHKKLLPRTSNYSI